MQAQQVTNDSLTSNTYVLSSAKSKRVWLIDVVNMTKISDTLLPGQKICGLLITHAHYDHICDINKLFETYPQCVVYASEYGRQGLYCKKNNLSYYHEVPVVFAGTNVQVLSDGDTMMLYDDCLLKVMHTPGHNPGSLTFKAGRYLFTGDSYIPCIKVVTKLKGGSRNENELSLQKIHEQIQDDTIICPGHGKMMENNESHIANSKHFI